MKRLLLTALAAATFVAPMAAAPAFAAPPQSQQQAYNNRNDRDWNDNRGRNDRRDNRRFDERRDNGYYIGSKWYFGPPPAKVYQMRDYRPGYKAWRKGDRLGYYNTRYVEVDYRRAHLKAPPRGYHYVKSDNGEIILAAIAGGLIAAIIAGN